MKSSENREHYLYLPLIKIEVIWTAAKIGTTKSLALKAMVEIVALIRSYQK